MIGLLGRITLVCSFLTEQDGMLGIMQRRTIQHKTHLSLTQRRLVHYTLFVNSNFPSKDEKQKRAMTIIDLLQYLHQRILDNLARQDEEELIFLSTSLREVWEAVEKHGVKELY